MKRKTAEGQEQEKGNPPLPPPPPMPVRIIRMPDSKPWRRPQRPRPMMYNVDSSGFRQLVQSLTGNSPQPPPQLPPLRPRPVLAQPPLPLRPRPVLAQPPLPPPALMGDELGVMVWPSSHTAIATTTATTSSYASSSASAIWSPATMMGDCSYPFLGDGEQQN